MRALKGSMKIRLYGLIALAVIIAYLVLTTPVKADDTEKVINFGIISTESSQNLRKIWEPFLEDMERQTGLTIKAFFAADYAGIIEGMRFNKVQMAWYGNKAAIESVDRAGGEVFMRTINFDGSEGYYSHIIAHRDSPLSNIEDMFRDSKNLIFGNGDPNSTSGFLVPSYYVFAMNDVDPKTAFKRTLTSNHEANALSVASKQLDVATCNSENMERLSITFPEKREQIKIIWTSPLIPSDPLVWRKDLNQSAKTKIENFLLSYGQNEREAEILESLQWKGFAKADNNHLNAVRQLELFKEKRKLEAEKTLNQTQKDRLSEIEKQLAELN